MRASAAILILSACLHAHHTNGLNIINNILDCTVTIGPVKCLNAFTAWRAKRAIERSNLNPNLTEDLELFPWKKYTNNTDEELYSEVCEGTEQLLRRRPLTLSVLPGYRLKLLSKGNGTLSVDVLKNAESRTGRSSMKKAKKSFYKFMPLLVLPGLMMSAILPFVLPALKMMVIGVGMLNNMALSGAVFTLLRNNAFNDKYEHKLIYVNQGYKNEKHANMEHANIEHEYNDHATNDHHEYQFSELSPSGAEVTEIEAMEELPLHSDWMKEYYGNGQNIQRVQNDYIKIKRGDRLQSSKLK